MQADVVRDFSEPASIILRALETASFDRWIETSLAPEALQSQNFPHHLLNEPPRFLSVSVTQLFTSSEITIKTENGLESDNQPREHIKKQRHYFAHKGLVYSRLWFFQ